MKKTIIFLVGIICFIISFIIVFKAFKTGGYFGVGILFFSLPFGLIAGICFHRTIGGELAERFAFSIFHPYEKMKTKGINLGPIRALASQHNYDEAIEELETILKKHPGYCDAILLLADILIDNKKNYQDAYGLLLSYRENRKQRAINEYQFIIRLIDMCSELNQKQTAVTILQEELDSRHYSKADEMNLQYRLEAIEQSKLTMELEKKAGRK